MGVIRPILIALALVAVPASAAFASVAPLDTVSEDASDDSDDPSEVKTPGTYDGFLHPPNDQDWYFLQRNGWYSGGGEDPACVSVTFKGDILAGTYLWSEGTEFEDYFVSTGISPVDDAVMGLVLPRFSKAVFGISSAEGEVPQLGTSSGFYEFTVDAETINELDSQSNAEDGLPSCFAPLVPEDGTFMQSFTVDEAVNFTVSAAEAFGISVSIEEDEGMVVDDLILASEEEKIASVSLPAGTYDLVVENSGTSDSSPLLGVTLGPDDDDDDPRRPCYPNC